MTNKKELIIMTITGILLMACLNVMMLQYHYDIWTNPKVGFWSAFFPRFEISGFDSYTYITVSSWRPLYVLSRHPLLAAMVWPLSELNSWLMEEYKINCAIFIVAAVWTLLALASWLLTFRIMRRSLHMSFGISALLTAWFFSFSHIMLVTFTPDHMSITLPLLLLTVYLAAKAIECGRAMPLWQSLPLLFISTGVTLTNMVKIGLADVFTQWGRKPFGRIVLHFTAYLVPLAIIAGLYFYQMETTQAEETRSNNELMTKKAQRDPAFAQRWEKDKENRKEMRKKQLLRLDIVTNTEHHIDRLPSLTENIFGEGFILHDRYTLQDANRSRPALVRYTHWWCYAAEALIVLLFIAGVWCGRRSRLMWMTFAMFLFDMLLHVGLEFANSDAYIMTAHWAFCIPIAVAYLVKAVKTNIVASAIVTGTILALTIFMWGYNLTLIWGHLVS